MCIQNSNHKHATPHHSLSSSAVSLISPSSSSSSLTDFTNMSIISPVPTPIPDDDSNTKSLSTDINSILSPLNLSLLNAAPKPASTIADIKLEDTLPAVFCESRARIPLTTGGEVFLHVYRNDADSKEHIAFVFGNRIHSKSLFEARPGETEQDRMIRGAYDGVLYPGRATSNKTSEATTDTTPRDNTQDPSRKDVLVRIHSECYTGETAWSARCDCGEQLEEAARLMAAEGEGVIIYLRQEGRGIGLAEKLKAYNLQDLGADTVTANLLLRHPADARSFGLATAMLRDLGCTQVRLMTNNPDKIRAVEGRNKEIEVTERVPMVPLSWQNKGGFQSKEVDQYLKTKIERMGHMLPQ